MRLALLTLLLLSYTTQSLAGSNFSQLSKTVEIVDWDKWVKAKKEADEYAKRVGATVVCSSEVLE